MRGLGLLLLLCGCASPPRTDDFSSAVLAALAPAGGEWGVYYKDLSTGAELSIRARDDFHPASTLKVWVMIKVHEDVRDGKYALDDEVPVEKTFLSAAKKDPKPFDVKPYDPGVAESRRLKIRDLVEAMITVSDNVATNNLIRTAGGPDAITASLARYGIARSNVRRYIMDSQAFAEGMSSVAVPREFGLIFEKLSRGEVVSRAASEEMLAVLGRLKGNSMLPGRLPKGARVAHKTGAIEGVRCDAGLVTLPDGRRFVAVFFARGLKDEKKGEACLAEAARLLYDFMEKTSFSRKDPP